MPSDKNRYPNADFPEKFSGIVKKNIPQASTDPYHIETERLSNRMTGYGVRSDKVLRQFTEDVKFTGVDLKTYSRFCEDWATSKERFPTYQQMKTVISPSKSNAPSEIRDKCAICFDSGVVTATPSKDKNAVDVAVACNCIRGKKYIRNHGLKPFSEIVKHGGFQAKWEQSKNIDCKGCDDCKREKLEEVTTSIHNQYLQKTRFIKTLREDINKPINNKTVRNLQRAMLSKREDELAIFTANYPEEAVKFKRMGALGSEIIF